ncbi:MAG: hypothetical protein ACLQVX_17870 [Limisphaerales bacterium]
MLAKEIRRDVFEDLDHGLDGLKGFFEEYDRESHDWSPETQLLAVVEAERLNLWSGMAKAFLRDAEKLLAPLLDYGCARAFGNNVSLERQRAALDAVSGAITRDLDAAIGSISGCPDAQKKIETQDQETKAAKAKAEKLEKEKNALVKKLEGLRQRQAFKRQDQVRPALGRKVLNGVRTIMAVAFAIPGALAGLAAVGCALAVIFSFFEDHSQVGQWFGWGGDALVVAVICLGVAGRVAPPKPLPEQIAEVEKEITTIDSKIAELTGQASAPSVPVPGAARAQPTPGLPQQSRPSWIVILGGGFLAVMILGAVGTWVYERGHTPAGKNGDEPSRESADGAPPSTETSRWLVTFSAPVNGLALVASNYVITDKQSGRVIPVYQVKRRASDCEVELITGVTPGWNARNFNLKIERFGRLARDANGPPMEATSEIKDF